MALATDLPAALPESGGSTYFSSWDSGDDTTGDGGILNPWKTITKLLTQKGTETGAILRARGGVYLENINVPNCHGVALNPITLEPHNGEPVTIRKQSAAGSNFPLVMNNWDYARVRRLVIDGNDVENSGVEDADVYLTGGSTFVSVEDLEVVNSREQGILADPGTLDCQYLRNEVHGGGTLASGSRDHAMYIQGSRALIANNLVYDWENGHGVQIYPEADAFWIVHNTIAHIDYASGGYHSSGLLIGSDPSNVGPSDNHIVVGNLLINCKEGIQGYNSNGQVKSLSGGITLPVTPITLNNTTSMDASNGQALIADINNDALDQNGLVSYASLSGAQMVSCATLLGSGMAWANAELVVASPIDYVAGTGTVAHHNAIYAITYIKRRCCAQSGSAPIIDFQGNDVLSDPLIVSDVNRNYHLQSGSPLYNAGVDTLCPLNDFDGNPRTVPTLGAFRAPEELTGLGWHGRGAA